MNLGVRPEGRYRLVDEGSLLEELAMLGWPDLVRAGQVEEARRLAAESLEAYVARGLPHRTEGGRRLYDSCEVHNFINSTHGAEVPLSIVSQEIERRMVLDAKADMDEGAGSRVEVTIRRAIHVGDRPPGTKIRLRLPYPFEDGSQRALRMEAIRPIELSERCTPEPGRITVEAEVLQGQPEIVVEARFSVELRDEPSRDDSPPAELDLYLKPKEGLIVVTPFVESLARSLGAGAGMAALETFWGFYFDRMRTGLIHFDELDSKDPLRSLVELGWSDCHSGSALIAALCRSVGIPARLVGGYLLYPLRPAPHYWLEVYLPPDGWVSFDIPFSWNLAGGDRTAEPWSRLFFGRVDRRLKIQQLPRIFTGTPGVQVPSSWYFVQRLDGATAELTLCDRNSGRWLHRDSVRVTRCTTGSANHPD